MTKERLRRSDPPRSEPIRDWEQLFRQPQSDNAGKNDTGNGEDRSAQNGVNGRGIEDAVTNAVKLGYRIVEEQIRQGKRAAEQVAERPQATSSIGGDVAEFVRRLLQFYTDIGATCFEFIDSLTRNKGFTDNVRGWLDEGLARAEQLQSANNHQADSYQNLPIDVQSTHPTRVALQLSGPATGCQLGVHGLYGLDSSNPPLRAVTFRYATPDEPPTLCIRIPQDQPADSYTGAVVDMGTNQPRGTLNVTIRHEVSGSS